jgi:hypothetical protein
MLADVADAGDFPRGVLFLLFFAVTKLKRLTGFCPAH